MLIYVAGKMTGQPLYGYEQFMLAKRMWQKLGHEVLVPFDATNKVWQKHFGRDYNPAEDSCEYGSDVMLNCWREDVNLLLRAEAIVLLPEWEESRGARIEVQTGILFGKKLFNAFTLEEITLKVSVSFNTE